jgi:hypothetical protein
MTLRNAALMCCAIGMIISIPVQSVASLQLKGDGITDDTLGLQSVLNTAAKSCATIELPCTRTNLYKVSSTIRVPKCVKLSGACGGIPDEGSATTVGTTLQWAGPAATPVVLFHDAPGASLSRVSIDCQNVAKAIGIRDESNDNPATTFVNIGDLMIRGCHR